MESAIKAGKLRLCGLGICLALAGPAGAVPPLALVEKTPTLDFSWQIPAAVAAEPKLYAQLHAAAEHRLRHDRRSAAAAADTRLPGDPVRSDQTVLHWSVTAVTPRLLVLTGEIYRFTGGAHGNTGFQALLWDRRAQREIKLQQVFTDWPRVTALVTPVMCAALAAAQAERRKAYQPDATFDKCPPLSDATLLPAGPPPLRLRVLFSPYSAGPYSEGTYQLDLDWPAAALGLVQPRYRADLRPRTP